MKGIAHFVTGVASATFIPRVVQAGASGSVLPMLGGLAGLLPDTLDFKFVRYLEGYDLEVDPGPEPDAGEIAREVAGAMRRAYETGEPQIGLYRRASGDALSTPQRRRHDSGPRDT